MSDRPGALPADGGEHVQGPRPLALDPERADDQVGDSGVGEIGQRGRHGLLVTRDDRLVDARVALALQLGTVGGGWLLTDRVLTSVWSRGNPAVLAR